MSKIKDIFPEFYRDKLEDVLNSENSSKTLYVLDTNYFLDIYRLESSIAIKFVEAIEKLDKNIFIPFQVVLEFHMNRKNVIISRENNRENFKNQINHEFNNLFNNINNTGSLNFKEKNVFLETIGKKVKELKKELLDDI